MFSDKWSLVRVSKEHSSIEFAIGAFAYFQGKLLYQSVLLIIIIFGFVVLSEYFPSAKSVISPT